jgi:hypothetical protein
MDYSIFSREWWCSAFQISREGDPVEVLSQLTTSLAKSLKLKLHKTPIKERGIVLEELKPDHTRGEPGKWSGVIGVGILQDLQAFSPLGQELVLTEEMDDDQIGSTSHDYPKIVVKTASGVVLAHPFVIGVMKLGRRKLVVTISAPYLAMEQVMREALQSSGDEFKRLGIDVEKLFRAVSENSFEDKDLYFCAGRMIVEGVTSLRSATFAGQDVIRNWLYEYLNSPEMVSSGIIVSPKDCKVRRTYGPDWVVADRRALFLWFNENGVFRLKPGGENGGSFMKLFEIFHLFTSLGFSTKAGK